MVWKWGLLTRTTAHRTPWCFMRVHSVLDQPRLWHLQWELQDIGITCEKNPVLEGLKFRAELLFVHQMRESSPRNVITPPTPDHLCSIQHVCKCKERYHPPPPQTTCVASNMCASARNVIIPPTPDHLCSIQHVGKCKERYHPPPHPRPPA